MTRPEGPEPAEDVYDAAVASGVLALELLAVLAVAAALNAGLLLSVLVYALAFVAGCAMLARFAGARTQS